MDSLRSALRSLRRTPAVTLAAIVTLSAGIGGLCAIFGVLEVTLLRPLPVAHEEQMVRLHDATRQPDGTLSQFNIVGPHFNELAAQSRTLTSFAAFSSQSATITSGELPEHVEAVAASPGALQALGIAPLAGFPAAEGAVVIGEALARRQFGETAIAVGRSISIDGAPRTIAGVMPAWFRFPYHAEVWLTAAPSNTAGYDYAVFARLAPGATIAQVRSELAAIAPRIPGTDPNFLVVADPMRETLIGRQQDVALLLSGVLGAFLLLACASVATLLLARSAARSKELAVRSALGASRARLMRELLLESALIALGGAALGVLVAQFAASLAMQLAPGTLTLQLGLHQGPDWRLVSFALACGVISALAAGVAPSLQASRPDLREVLNEGGGAGSSSRSHRLLHALVIVQTALAFALLTGGGLVIEDFRKLAGNPVGFEPQGLTAAQIALPQARYAQGARRAAFVAELERQVRALPAVEAAGVTSMNPFDPATWTAPMIKLGEAEGAARSVNHRLTMPGVFAAMQIPLLKGRDFTGADGPSSEPVVILSDSVARRLWPGEEPLGKQVRIARAGTPWMTVVGIAGEVEDSGEIKGTWYLPYAQRAGTPPAESFHLMVRSAAPDLERSLRRLVASLDPLLAVDSVRPMEAVRAEGLQRPRLGASAVAVFAAFGLLLAALGTFGVISFTIAQRRREMGVRMALGATAPRIARLVLRRALMLALIGELAGTAAALLLHGALQSHLTALTGLQPRLYAFTALLLSLVAAAAALVPAARAAAVDPAEAMRAS